VRCGPPVLLCVLAALTCASSHKGRASSAIRRGGHRARQHACCLQLPTEMQSRPAVQVFTRVPALQHACFRALLSS
jgi:hypothetical protein